jgi:hypothetical protein
VNTRTTGRPMSGIRAKRFKAHLALVWFPVPGNDPSRRGAPGGSASEARDRREPRGAFPRISVEDHLLRFCSIVVSLPDDDQVNCFTISGTSQLIKTMLLMEIARWPGAWGPEGRGWEPGAGVLGGRRAPEWWADRSGRGRGGGSEVGHTGHDGHGALRTASPGSRPEGSGRPNRHVRPPVVGWSGARPAQPSRFRSPGAANHGRPPARSLESVKALDTADEVRDILDRARCPSGRAFSCPGSDVGSPRALNRDDGAGTRVTRLVRRRAGLTFRRVPRTRTRAAERAKP